MDEIGVQTLSSRKTVRRYLLHYEIPLRTQDKLIIEQVRFGTRRVKGTLGIDPKEVNAILKIRELRNQGQTFREIVASLNNQNIPCRKQGAKWHLKTVFAVLKQN